MQRFKHGNGVSVKLALPKDLPWQIFGKLMVDLGVKSHEFRDIFGAVRNRDVAKFLNETAKLSPRSIMGATGTEKADAFSFFKQYQLGALLKKYPFKGIDTKAASIKKFFEAEDSCRLFNDENFKALIALDERHPEFYGILDEIRNDIEKLIGSEPNIGTVFDHAKHGPGVSLGDLYERGKCTDYYKWSNLPYTVTQGTLPYARTAIESDPRWIGAIDDWYRSKNSIPFNSPIDPEQMFEQVFDVVDGSRITSVPKTALTDRTIAIEPVLNVYLQLGVDHVLKSLLKRGWGYDLSSQERNQKYALLGAKEGLLATLDLSMASDTIALMLCFLLLPPMWLDLLLDLRSPQGEIEGVKHSFDKISSMGNGFTFALESLIFGALVRCAIRRTESVRKSAVFGDDIIVPTTAVPYLKTLLEYSGFKLNMEKSYWDGPFRESCGKDFFYSYDVRPLFLTRKISTVRDLFYVHNALVSLASRLDWTWDVNFSHTLALIRRYIPKNVQECFYGPETEELDTHLFSHKKLMFDKDGDPFYWTIISRPIVFDYKRYEYYYFRKLMKNLSGLPIPPVPKWEKKRFNTGNAFDVTRRGSVLEVSNRCYPVRTGYSDHKKPAYLVRPAPTRGN